MVTTREPFQGRLNYFHLAVLDRILKCIPLSMPVETSMRVVIKFHESAKADYDAWIRRLSQPPTGNTGMALVHADELIRELQRTEGIPSQAIYHPELDPPSWVWRYTSTTWIRFVRKQRRTILGGATLEIVVIGLLEQSPA
jgi:hypothetical protein